MTKKIFALCIVLSLTVAASAETPKRILFINSYHKGYTWGDDIEKGFLERLNGQGMQTEVSFEYLDSLRYTYEQLAPTIAETLKIKYADPRPDIVVVSDTTAFSFLKTWRDSLFPGVPAVFCGYNNFTPEALGTMRNVTGVNENIDIIALVKLALSVQPNLTTLAFIVSTGDATNRSLYDSVVRYAYPAFRSGYNVVLIKDETMSGIKDRLALLPRSTAVFLTGQTTEQTQGRALSPEENAKMITEISSYPCYAAWEFQMGYGTLGGNLITGREQGAAAGDMTLQILAGLPADSIPVLMQTPTTPVFDWRTMTRFGIRESALPPGSVILRKPESPWAVWPIQVGGIVFLVLAETVSILMLLRLGQSRRRTLAELAEERALLGQRVAERTAELTAANERLKIASETDPLTGLANRRAFSRKLEQEFSRLKRTGGMLSLIMLDIDHFKRFNDTYGHLEGDECLIRVASVVGESVQRPYDLAARFGGEEFIAILPETGMEGAMKVAQRIHEGVSALMIPHATSETHGYVSVSVGVITALPFRANKPLTMVDMVDGIMYRAKNAGRNRIEAVDFTREQASQPSD